MFNNILVAIDGSEHSLAGIRYAIYLAEKFNSEVTGIHVIDAVAIESSFYHDLSGTIGAEPFMNFSEDIRRILEERGKAVVELFTKELEGKKILSKSIIETGVVSDILLNKMKMYDLLIVGQRGLAGQKITDFFGSNVSKVLRKSDKPVMVVSNDFKKIEKALLCYDGSIPSTRALHTVAEICGTLKVPISTVIVSDEDAGKALQNEVRGYLEPFGIDTEFLVAVGNPHEIILDIVANDSYDALFMGAFGHNRIIELMLGSTTEHVLRNIEIPVFLTR